MRRSSSLLLNVFLLFMAISLFTSCEPDILEPTVENPSINFVIEEPYVSGSATVATGAWFEVKVDVNKGSEFLRTVTVYEDDIKISDYTARLTYNGTTFEANPKLLTDLEKEGFQWVIGIKAHEEGDMTKTYKVEITDEGRNFQSTEVAISTESVPPSFSFVQEAPYFWGDITITEGARFKIKLKSEAGSSPIKTIAVLEDDVAITDLARIRYKDVDFTANPLDVPVEDQNGVEAEISIKAHEVFGTKVYKIMVTDEAQNTAMVEFNVSTGTAVTSMEGKLLLNAGGGTGTGGLNLMNGVGTGSSDATAHIKDMGIDTDKVLAENWLQKIAGINGSVLRTLGSNTPETFSFDNIRFKEEIVGLYDNGVTIMESEAVAVGDIFMVKNGEMHFILKVTKVNIETLNNDDSIEFSIKH